MALEDRVNEYTDRQGDDECWVWTGTFGHAGCPTIALISDDFDEYEVPRQFGTPAEHTTSALRIIWGLEYGDVPETLVVFHRCRNNSCVNPRHLELGTEEEKRAWHALGRDGD